MRFSLDTLIYFFAAITVTDGMLSRITLDRELMPGEIGSYHTDAFEILGAHYSQQKPSSQLDVMKDMIKILSDYCPIGDSDCAFHAYKITKDEFQLATRGFPRKVKFPAEFDPKMKHMFDSMVSSVKSINELNLDDVVDALNDIQDKLEEMSNVDKVHQTKILAAVSVAVESTKLWHATHFDEEHPLNPMISYFSTEEDRDRRLQIQNIPFNVASVAIADFTSIFTIGVEEIFGDRDNIVQLLFSAIASSGAAFFNDVVETDFNLNDDDEEDDEYYYSYNDDNADDQYYNNNCYDDVDDEYYRCEDDVFDEEIDDFLCQIIGTCK